MITDEKKTELREISLCGIKVDLGDVKLDLVRRDGGATPKPAFRASAGLISLPGGALRPSNGRADPS